MLRKVVFLLFCLVCLTGAADEGDSCVKDGVPGTCLNIRNCQQAVDDLKNKRKVPQICSFVGTDPVVCCAKDAPPTAAPPTPAPTTARPPVATTPKRPVQTSTDRFSSFDYDSECEPISDQLTSPKTGKKAWDMCVEYQHNLVYPCKRGSSLFGGLTRQYLCHHNADDLIVGGEDAAQNEFTHMVLLGYGSSEASVTWQCGGSLISDQWILTAGHCTSNRNYGQVKFALMGALRRSDPIRDNMRRVERYLNAPGYEHASRYNDIALIKVDKPVKLDQFLVPACVHIGDPVNETRVLATGWGLTEHKGQTADTLQKVILNKFGTEECSDFFPPGDRHMLWGLESTTQTCYGDKDKSKDTCQGDSGGPLMIKSRKIHCMYVITGVTSFGKRCGKIGSPAIYTRVSQFVDWIEQTVWP